MANLDFLQGESKPQCTLTKLWSVLMVLLQTENKGCSQGCVVPAPLHGCDFTAASKSDVADFCSVTTLLPV